MWAHVQDTERRRRGLTDALVSASFIAAVLYGALSGSAQLVCDALLGEQFREAGPLVSALAVFGFLSLLSAVAGSSQEALGYLSDLWKQQIVHAACTLPLLVLLVLWHQALLAASSLVLGQLGAHAMQIAALSRRRIIDKRQLLRAYATHGTIFILVASGCALISGSGLTLPAAILLTTAWVLTSGAILFALRRRVPGLAVIQARGVVDLDQAAAKLWPTGRS
jgi:O-antigen/teichoic acid export membrane protein